MKSGISGLLIIILSYLLFWPVAIDPVAWHAPEDEGFTGQFASNNTLANMSLIDLKGNTGPEDFAVNSEGRIAISTHSGDILSFDPKTESLSLLATTQGRPLGIEFDQTGALVIADAERGLLRLDAENNLTVLATSFDNNLLGYVDDVDLDSAGNIYFSDASSKFSPRNASGALEASLEDLMEHGGHGRVYRYSPSTQQLTLLVDNLNFANGIAVSHDQKSVLINETGAYRVLRYWLSGKRQGQVDVVIDNLPGFPDNIARDETRGYWLGLASPRSTAVDALAPYPFLRKIVQRLPEFMRPAAKHYGHIVHLDETGQVLASLQDPQGKLPMTTGAIRIQDRLYISSLTSTSFGILDFQ
ncbi:SMP-30/gluconolactonase/LRE family protein [Aestuariibacter salexigens]|uniref:SMP-30/gluconolactonase/LRE family protein n=1 Tax=Aestuariibacter salexigens TaxID=226010 RepID=UPI00047B5792|nr:SMP-30/gluconolactonase/LRE family protein [Aestuariibacter salexigens]